jgi:DNA invertase Pin-like site-specific DNA recombinase
MNRLIGYVRSLINGLTLDTQISSLKKVGCTKIFKEKTVRKNRYRTLNQCIASLKKGNTLVVYKYNILASTLEELISRIEEIKNKGCYFYSISENINTRLRGNYGDLFVTLIKFKKTLKKKSKGRPKVLSDEQIKDLYDKYINKTYSTIELMKIFDINTSTFYHYLKKMKERSDKK